MIFHFRLQHFSRNEISKHLPKWDPFSMRMSKKWHGSKYFPSSQRTARENPIELNKFKETVVTHVNIKFQANFCHINREERVLESERSTKVLWKKEKIDLESVMVDNLVFLEVNSAASVYL
jgi:hypothetical protein